MTAAPCRAGPMCPAEKCVPGGGAHGPRPTGRYVEPRVGDGVPDVPSARQRRAGNGLPRRFAPRNDKVRRGGRLCPSRFATHSRDFVGDGVPDVPPARQRRAVIPSQCSHWRGNPSPRKGGRLCPSRIPAAKTHLPPSRRRKKVTGRRRSLGFTDETAACTPRSTGQRSGTSWRGRWTDTHGYRRNRIPAR